MMRDIESKGDQVLKIGPLPLICGNQHPNTPRSPHTTQYTQLARSARGPLRGWRPTTTVVWLQGAGGNR